jgi:hypothetical protein
MTAMSAHVANRQDADRLAVESSVIGKVLFEFLDAHGGFDGTATALLTSLEREAGFVDFDGGELKRKQRPKGWPGNAKAMSGQLKRIAPYIRKLGWDLDTRRDTDRARTRRLTIRKSGEACVLCVRSGQEADMPGQLSDANQPSSDANEPPRTEPIDETGNDRTLADAADEHWGFSSDGHDRAEI